MDIEKLAREAHATVMLHTAEDQQIVLYTMDEAAMRRFAALVVEECADACDSCIDVAESMYGINAECRATAALCIDAIRSLSHR